MSGDVEAKAASGIEAGEIVKLDGALWRVVDADHQRGMGKSAGVSHLKLRALAGTGVKEKRCKPDDRIETLAVVAERAEFLFAEAGRCTFMNARTFEQFEIPDEWLGAYRPFLAGNETLEVEFHAGAPIAVRTPETAIVTVAKAPPGVRGDTEAGFKTAVLANGALAQVPQFVSEGDRVRIEVGTLRYVERVREPR